MFLICYSSLKSNWEGFGWFLTLKIDFESQNFAIFTAIFLIGCCSAKDLLHWESVIYHSIKLGFKGQVAKKFLNGIYWPYILSLNIRIFNGTIHLGIKLALKFIWYFKTLRHNIYVPRPKPWNLGFQQPKPQSPSICITKHQGGS